MSLKALTTASTLYRGTSLTLEQAAAHSGLSPDELASYLRSQPGALGPSTVDTRQSAHE
ncbi:hypothetical protein [Halobaculum limi]|uniref:hypothetical protein n=1 Tax=Halobaculum limi TaxID=3031916 RepID=UPI0024052C78|nr:hypothetical protein [Halobaculum sp. YSMS11]